MNERILIIEDDEKIARMIELELGHEDYETMKAHDGIAGLRMAEDEDFSLVLLDIMLPGMSGIEVLRRLRKTKTTPVILLTARDEVVDKVLGLDSGADDYVTKPFVIEELLARIRAVLRKPQHADTAAVPTESGWNGSAGQNSTNSADIYTSGELILDAAAYTVTYSGEPVALTFKEFELLKCLLENKGRVMSRDALLNRVWGYDYIGETNTVDVYIRFLRSKIDARFDVKVITTVRGAGYKI
jgi:DNA-binding response OmpR family regulator